MKKIDTALEVIRERIVHGDPELTGVPSQRRLAEELGVSRKTIRLAFQRLLDDGELQRTPEGKVLPSGDSRAKDRQALIALVAHETTLTEAGHWHRGILRAIGNRDAVLRIVTYSHYGDAAILDALNRYHGVFFSPCAQAVPEWLKLRFQSAPCRIVAMAQQLTDYGIPSVCIFPTSAIVAMLDHLRDLGHRRIDCVNTQSQGPVIAQRISAWQNMLNEHGFEGSLHKRPTSNPMGSARRLVAEILNGGNLPSAIYCTTGPAAFGAMRAAHEAGIEIGKDLSICAVNDEGMAKVLIPSLTCVYSPSRAQILAKPVDWMMSKRKWMGPLLIEPTEPPLFIGESTCKI